MEGGKKTIAAVVLIVVIVLAVVLVAKRSGVIGGPQPPDWVMQQPVERIDAQSGELITKTLGEWESLGHKEGKYKNPNTKAYTMVSPMVCAACNVKIPTPDLPTAGPEAGPEGEAKMIEAQRAYKCPKCGKNPYPPEMLGTAPAR